MPGRGFTPRANTPTPTARPRRVAVSIGPEHGTVGPQQVKEAAKEAVQGVGFDMLIVCGFAFDPHVAEEAKRYGKLTVLPAKMNPDLAMGDELLKKTGAGNLFMVFGEPDVEITKQKDGQIVVEIKGVDVYDPTTGQIRSASTDDIACWFIDTDYNGESFFVRHAYFTGADDLRQAQARAAGRDRRSRLGSLYSTMSRRSIQPESRQDRREGHQPLRRRGIESFRYQFAGLRLQGTMRRDCEATFTVWEGSPSNTERTK